jgi:hypothetical protein
MIRKNSLKSNSQKNTKLELKEMKDVDLSAKASLDFNGEVEKAALDVRRG